MKNVWHYSPNYLGLKTLVDPRIAIAKHLDWRSITKNTTWTQPEPDNYNAAIFSSLPLDYAEARHQVFYRSDYHKGWFSVYYIKPSLIETYHDWIQTQPCWATWFTVKPAAFRYKLTILENKPHRQTRDLSESERLYQMNYYNRLKYKCVDSNIIDARVGEPTPGLVNFESSLPEAEDEDLL